MGVRQNKGNPTLNRWYTYTVDEDGTYTLKPATMTATLYADEMIRVMVMKR